MYKVYFLFMSIVVSIFLSGCEEKKVETSEKEVVRPVKLIEVKNSNELISGSYPATIQPLTSRKLSFQVSGKVDAVYVKDAQSVKKGQVLATIDSRDYANQLNQVKVQYDKAKTEFERAERLLKGAAISQSSYDERKSQLEVLSSQLDSAQKALSDTKIIAPFDAKISTVSIDELDTVQAGNPVITLFSNKRFQATINLPSNIIALSNKITNQSAHVTLGDLTDEKIQAQFDEANLQADEVTQTFSVTLSFEPPKDIVVLPGMNANVEISYSLDSKPTISIPLSSIQTDGQKNFVWVLDEKSMRVSKREIKLANSIGEMQTVLEGLSAGEFIVGAGASYLTEGLKVRAWEK